MSVNTVSDRRIVLFGRRKTDKTFQDGIANLARLECDRLRAVNKELVETLTQLLQRISDGSATAPIDQKYLKLALGWLLSTPEVQAARAALSKARQA